MKRILSITIAALVMVSCGSGTSKKQTATETKSADVTEVLYFHGKKRCITCNAIEKLTKEVVDSLSNDKIVMKVIDITQDEATADKYEITWSSLILDRGGKVENLTEMGFGYAKNQPALFKAKLTEVLTKIAE